MRQLQLLEPFNVVAIGYRLFGGGNMPQSKLISQVTKCRTLDGVIFYVRENCNGIQSFYLSAGERWGDKQVGPSLGRQILELCAPAGVWGAIAEMVADADALKRPVRCNDQFTIKEAEACVQCRKMPLNW